MITFSFTKKAFQTFQSLDQQTQSLVQDKLKMLKNPDVFGRNSKRLINLPPATHRIRAGRYRLLLKVDFQKEEYLVLKIGHRGDIYK